MGAAASASAASPPPEAVAPADPPSNVDIQPAAADPPAKVDIQSAAAVSPPPEASPAADPPAKEDIQPAATADAPPEASAPADSPAKEEIQSSSAAPGGDAGETVVFDAATEAGGEEEIGECPFCAYMKAGGCKDEFIEWEKCVEEAEGAGDLVERCAKATTALRKCMDNFAEYYEPILSAERRMSEDLEADVKAEAEGTQPSPASPPAPAEDGEQGDNKKQAEKEEEEVVVVNEKEDLAA